MRDGTRERNHRIDGDELLTVVSRRRQILDRIAAGTNTRETLQDDLNLSKSAVYKKLRQLQHTGLIEEWHGQYDTTLLYQMAAARRDDFTDLAQAQDLLSRVSNPHIGSDFFRNATFVVSTRYEPAKPIEALSMAVRSANEIRGATATTSPTLVDQFNKQLSEQDIDIEGFVEILSLSCGLLRG